MRILFLAHRLPYPPNKGEKIRAFTALKLLAERNDVYLLCFYDDPDDQRHVSNLQLHCKRVYAEPIPWLGSRLRAAKAVFSRRSFSLGFFYSHRMEAMVRRTMADERFDLVFVYSSAMVQYVDANAGVRCVVDMVDVDSDKWRQYGDYTLPPLSWLYRAEGRRLAECEGQIVRSASKVIVCSAHEAELLATRGLPAERIVVIDNAPPLELISRCPDSGFANTSHAPYVIFTGSMDYRPNIDAALYFAKEIFPEVQKLAPDINFVIAGRNPTRRIRRLSKIPGIIVTGAVPDMYSLLRNAAVAVAPLRIACGLQFKVLEALALGTPVVIGSKTASALPSALRSHVQVEDDPHTFAARVVKLARFGLPLPRHEVCRAVHAYYQESRLRTELNAIIEPTNYEDAQAATIGFRSDAWQ